MDRCENCGKFARWEDLAWDEENSLDILGNLTQRWPSYHKAGTGCAENKTSAETQRDPYACPPSCRCEGGEDG